MESVGRDSCPRSRSQVERAQPKQLAALLIWVFLSPFASTGASAQHNTSVVVDRDGSVRALPAALQRYAILVGVGNYSDPAVPRLQGPTSDVKALRDALVSYAGFPDDNVIVLSDERATRNRIVQSVYALQKREPKPALVLFAFAGHATSVMRSPVMLPYDAFASEDPELLLQTALPIDLLRQALHKVAPDQVIMLLDTSFSDPDQPVRHQEAELRIRDIDLPQGKDGFSSSMTMFAAGIGARAFTNPTVSQGYLATAIVEGLMGRAANRQGQVTLGALIKYVSDRVPNNPRGGGTNTFSARVKGYSAAHVVVAASSLTTKASNTKDYNYKIVASLRPVIASRELVNRDFQHYDSSEDCALNVDRSLSFCHTDSEELQGSSHQVTSANCGSHITYTNPDPKNRRCVVVGYKLKGCGTGPFGIGCQGRGWLGFTITLRGVLTGEKPLERITLSTERDSRTTLREVFQYPLNLLNDGRALVWDYEVKVYRDPSSDLPSITLSGAKPEAEGVRTSISADGLLSVDISEAEKLWRIQPKSK